MKNVLIAIVFSLFCSSVFANDCGSTCNRRPVRNTVSAVVNVVGSAVGVAGSATRTACNVATSPVRVTRNVLSNSRARRCCRRSCR